LQTSSRRYIKSIVGFRDQRLCEEGKRGFLREKYLIFKKHTIVGPVGWGVLREKLKKNTKFAESFVFKL
jgi:hypothetical protein